MRRGRYLKRREELIAVREVDDYADSGANIIYRRAKAIVSRRIYSTQSTDFEQGTNVPQEQYSVNMLHEIDEQTGILNKYDNVVAGNQVILGITDDTTDDEILEENRRVLTVKSPSVGVNITRLNCIEL